MNARRCSAKSALCILSREEITVPTLYTDTHNPYTENNHGTWFTYTTLALALHTGKDYKAKEFARELIERHIPGQINKEGAMPLELVYVAHSTSLRAWPRISVPVPGQL